MYFLCCVPHRRPSPDEHCYETFAQRTSLSFSCLSRTFDVTSLSPERCAKTSQKYTEPVSKSNICQFEASSKLEFTRDFETGRGGRRSVHVRHGRHANDVTRKISKVRCSLWTDPMFSVAKWMSQTSSAWRRKTRKTRTKQQAHIPSRSQVGSSYDTIRNLLGP